MNKLPAEITELLHEAEKFITSKDSPQQVIVVRTAKAHTYSFANHNIMNGDLTEEENFINELVEKEDTEIICLVCMWNKCELDIPSQHMRTLFTKINPLNREAAVLMRGEKDYCIKKLKELI